MRKQTIHQIWVWTYVWFVNALSEYSGELLEPTNRQMSTSLSCNKKVEQNADTDEILNQNFVCDMSKQFSVKRSQQGYSDIPFGEPCNS